MSNTPPPDTESASWTEGLASFLAEERGRIPRGQSGREPQGALAAQPVDCTVDAAAAVSMSRLVAEETRAAEYGERKSKSTSSKSSHTSDAGKGKAGK